MEWMEVDLLWNIGGMLGSMCKVDPIAESQINVSKPLRGTMLIDGRRVRVEYERIGHGRESRREGLQANQNEGTGMETKTIPPSQPEGSRNYQENGHSRTGFGGRNVRPENRGDFGPVKLKCGDFGHIKSKPGGFGSVKSKFGDNENLDKCGRGAKKKTTGFKYMGTSSNNVGKFRGSRLDILKDLADVDCEENWTKGVDLKQKGILSEVTNLKEKISVNKKPVKAKVSFKLMRNTSSGNEKHPFISRIFVDSIHKDRVDNSLN
ncbi:hypothetical protein ACOSQ4_007956 [Xanthoceras sorbifolium]